MNPQTVSVRVWDLPTRLFHWVLMLCVIGSVVSAKIGGNAMVWHFRLGYAVLALLAFRLLWGLVGGRWSRFASFLYGPAALMRYLKGASRPDEHHEVGHSPLGALSVFALLALLAAQVGSGLFADDEIASSGPLVRFVSGATSSLLTGWHKNWGQWLILATVALHVLAIIVYRVRRGRDLVTPMIVGDKPLPADVPAARDTLSTRGLALVLLAVCGAGAAWVASLGG
ncbi:MAG: cytochrome b/b6 domain-containing protein [Piscinibacter sp.]|uniref:cytochrome b/b6 domain-containing protein n=1 Tax=Piscinibacter sp. TaxID=1903157 RepID=UPI003D0B2022